MHVRFATREDLPAILDIYNEAVRTTTASADLEPQPLAARAAWFESVQEAGFPVLVAERQGVVIGWGALQPHKPRPGYRFTADNSIYIAEAARGQGVGRSLLSELLSQAERLPLRSILAGVSGDNEASLRLHRSLGFTDAGTFNAAVYKFGVWIDVVYLQYEVPGWADRLTEPLDSCGRSSSR